MKRINIIWIIPLRLLLILGFLAACGDGGGGGDSGSDDPAEPPQVVVPRAVTLNNELIRPWGLAFLPDNRMLVSEKGGSMVILSADGINIQEDVSGLPLVADSGQGGLLDVALASPSTRWRPVPAAGTRSAGYSADTQRLHSGRPGCRALR